MSTQQQIIEHILLINVSDDAEPPEVAAMVDVLNSLVSLDLAIYLNAGEVIGSRSSPLTFSHILHCRFKSNSDLEAFINHSEYMKLKNEFITPIKDGPVLAANWVSNYTTLDSPNRGSAMRIMLLKLKKDLADTEKSKVLEGIKGLEFGRVEYISYGENLSDSDLAKEYSICSILFFSEVRGLSTFDSDAELEMSSLKEMMKDSVVVDYEPNVTDE